MRLYELVDGSPVALVEILERCLEPVLSPWLNVAILLVLDVLFPRLEVAGEQEGMLQLPSSLQRLDALQLLGV